ncbi:hypothetical protein FQN50_005759 [Emmonsiellopsis sp. PD_5]|nr:hypothetical protein FQN50_005759 [Emmonsiellopsis sp. PD_5]
MSGQQTPKATSSAKDEEADILAELNAALAADPSLGAVAPKSQPEWEDYETLIANNPELMASVSTKGETTFFKSKDVWECGHEGPETETEIERDSQDDGSGVLINEVRGLCARCLDPKTNPALKDSVVVDGKIFYKSKDKFECGHEGPETLTDIELDPRDIGPDTVLVLVNESRGICPTCKEKWTKLEAAADSDGEQPGGPSSGPSGLAAPLPTYDEAWENNEPPPRSDSPFDGMHTQLGLLDLDDGPAKGKVAGGTQSPPDWSGPEEERAATRATRENDRYDDDEEGYYDDDGRYHYYDDDYAPYDEDDDDASHIRDDPPGPPGYTSRRAPRHTRRR